MKLKATRKARTCHACKCSIVKGDKYGQRSITLGSKKDGQSESFEGMTLVVHQMRVNVSLCKECANGAN
jgi:hypothetical protein